MSGVGDLTINDHVLTINADTYLPTDETAIPYGPAEEVKETPMDFTTPHKIGSRIDDDFQQLVYGKGYDHTYVLNKIIKTSFRFVLDANLQKQVWLWRFILQSLVCNYIQATG